MFANFIHPHSIFSLKNEDSIPTTPITSDTITAHFQEKIRCKTKNPVEITNIVDFDVLFFIFSSFLPKKAYK